MFVIVCHSRASRALARSFLVLTADEIVVGATTGSADLFMPPSSHRSGRQGLIQVKVLQCFRFQEKPND
jgi:hypothetical protein